MLNPIKIVTGKNCWDTKIYEGGKEITKEIDGIFGIDIVLRVDKLPCITIHRYNTKMEYISGAPHELTIINHEPKKIKGTDAILEDTNYSNCKGVRRYIKRLRGV